MCSVVTFSRRTVDPKVSPCDHRAITLHSYSGCMSRSSAWHALRGRTRSTRPATTPNASPQRGPRFSMTTAAEHVRPIWPSESKLEEWKSLEFRHLKPPSDEDWNR